MMFRNACKAYSRLLNESRDRALTPEEAAALAIHAQACNSCAQSTNSDDGLDQLQSLSLAHEVSTTFDSRVLRKWDVYRKRATISYWSPAIAGAAIAALCLFAAIQLVSRSRELPGLSIRGAEVRRTDAPPALFPDANPSEITPTHR